MMQAVRYSILHVLHRGCPESALGDKRPFVSFISRSGLSGYC